MRRYSMQNYQRIIMRAHEAFQHRLKQVEIELAEAQHALEILDLQALDHERRTMLALGQNSQDSPLSCLPDEVMHMIAQEVETK